MTETEADSTQVESAQNDEPAAESTYVPNVVRVHGKEFDVNDPAQKAQLQGWDEAHAKLVGRQTNELGALRKFAEARKPTGSDNELVAKAKQKAAEGNFDEAIEEVFSSLKGQLSEERSKAEAERKNDELWTEYLSERPELAKSIGLKRVKTIGSTLDIYNPEKDAFAVLDEFFNPLARSEKPSAPKGEPDKKPPVTVSGGARKVSAPAAAARDSESAKSFEDIIDSRSVNQRRKTA